MRQHVPAIGFEALGGIVAEPALDLAVDRDAVVVVDQNQLAELLRPGKRGHFVRDALHHAAVAQKYVRVMIDDGVAGPIEGRGKRSLRERHADRVREALAKRAGRGLDAQVHLALRVARRSWSRIGGNS